MRVNALLNAMQTGNHERRMRCFRDAGLYLVTSAEHSAGRTTENIATSALRAGLRLVQLREKNIRDRELFETARRLRMLTMRHDALLIINDRVDIALAVQADGVHLGQDDFPLAEARRLAPEMIIGVSSHNAAEAATAQREGASYVNIGPLFPTSTKEWSDDFLGIEGLRKIAPAVDIPFTVMGGIKLKHVPELLAAGARTIAVVSAVTAAPDPGTAVGEFLGLIKTFPTSRL